jgi:hypothetical protein
MLNGPAVAFPAVFVGFAVGTLVWFLTSNFMLAFIGGLVTAVLVGTWCFQKLKG